MSLTAHSPFVGHKRLHGETDSPERGSLSPKRLRTLSGSPPPSCARREKRAYRAGRLPASTLRSLFPSMDEKVLVDVLESCGNNIDEAIKRLGDLQLASKSLEAGAAAQSQRAANTASEPSVPSADGPRQQDAAAGTSPAQGTAERTPAQWVEGLVQQMAAARDVNDARVRATNEMRLLEHAVAQATNKARQAEIAALQAKVMELAKENGVLKRAVAIQQSRLVESAEATRQQATQAEGIISQLQSKIHALEMSNYSLSMHLRQATADARPDSSHPDVF